MSEEIDNLDPTIWTCSF